MNTQGFGIIEPRKITLVSTNAVDEDYPLCSEGGAVAAGEYRIYNNYIYLAIEDIPASCDIPADENPAYYPQQPVNSYAMLTAASQQQSQHGETTAVCSRDGGLDITLSMRKCDTIALFGVKGKNMTIYELDVNDNVLKETSYKIIKSKARTHYQFWTQIVPEYAYRKVVHPLVFSFSQKVRIVIETAGTAEIAFIVAGVEETIGCTQFAPTSSQINVRAPVKNDFGNVQLIKGPLARSVSCEMLVETDQLDWVTQRLDALANTAAVFRAIGDSETFLQFGYISGDSDSYESSAFSRVSLDIESFIYTI